ncbi:MAG: class I SAM-dependent methyltransferase [Verrucomicrobiota bacterium]
MNPIRWLKGIYRTRKASSAKRNILVAPILAGDPEDFAASLEDPTRYYLRAFQDFHNNLPVTFREHRTYFSANGRGFGEDAFHIMWWRLFKKFKPASFLEIGIYRGQVLSLIALLAKEEGVAIHTAGVSPFCPAGDSVSRYRDNLDYQQDTLANFQHFNLPVPDLLKAYSTDPEAVAFIKSRSWDMIYIDGNHDAEIVRKDWEVCSASVPVGGIIVLDDAGLTTSYKPPAFATGGHPGPSQIATEIDPARFREILQVGHNRVFQRIA